MERLEPTHVIHRAFSVMAADQASGLSRDERTALLCWLQGLPHNIVILLPDDLIRPLVVYLGGKHPELLQDVALAFGEDIPSPKPWLHFDSPLDVDFWLEWHHQALNLLYPLSPQYWVKNREYRMDFAYPPLRVGIELDSYTYHSDRETFTRDRQRQREIEADGWHIIRFSGDEILADVVKCVKDAAALIGIQQFHQQQRQAQE